MRIHIIACRVFTRELSYFSALSPHKVDITWMPQGLHDTPDLLHKMVDDTLHKVYEDIAAHRIKYAPDFIALGYGLCSNGIVGICSRDIPLVIPRTDDCIALFLGSQKRYLKLFETFNGTYWLNNGWIETCYGSSLDQEQLRQKKLEEYTQLYGEDNAEFLLEQEDLWVKNYNTCAYISSPVYKNDAYPMIAREMADNNGWNYTTLSGDTRMIRMLTEGQWNDDEFLICPPHHRIEASYDEQKIKALPIE